MRVHGWLLIGALAGAFPAFAQEAPAPPPDDRIQKLEQKLDQLLQQAEEIRQELQQIKGQPAPAAAEDLTKVGVETPAAPPPALTDVTTVNNAGAGSASKALNPDISVIGNFIGHAGDVNPFERPHPSILFSGLNGATAHEVLLPGESRSALGFDEAEMAFETYIDPYAKGRFFFSVTPGGIDLEEGYAQFVTLPYGLTAKVGKMKAMFGKDNTWHTHARPWVDQPLVVERFFGEEGLNDTGISVSKSFNNPWNAFIELTGEAFNGNVDNVFAKERDNQLFYNAHLKFFHDLTENSNLELGTSWSHGHLAGMSFPDLGGLPIPIPPVGVETTPGGSNRFAGVDATYRWKPLNRSIYNSFIARFEGIANKRPDFGETLRGFYASADYQLGQRWFTGVRLDSADRFLPFVTPDLFIVVPPQERQTDRAASATLTFWPSEFSQIRGQFRHSKYAGEKSVNEFLIQLQFAIGAHGAHVF